MFKKSLFKVGDSVRIKDHYDKDCGPRDYKYIFTTEMLKRYGGKVLVISKIDRNYLCGECPKTSDDNCRYKLDGDPDEFSWASSMFTAVVQPSIF